MQNVRKLARSVGVQKACAALGLPRATFYRRPKRLPRPRPRPPLALSPEERQQVLEILHSPRFVDAAPRQIWAQLLDEERFVCSVRTMYRLLEAQGENRERRSQRRRPAYEKPELLATGPNQVWSWDLTKLKGPGKWSVFYLYVILDIFSRCVVGWMLAHRESKALASRLLAESIDKQGIKPGQLTVHADRGASMTSKTVAQLLVDLGVEKTHSRPYTSNDNPFSEAHFKTLKYQPTFPQRFATFGEARAFCGEFISWYNSQHCHTSLALLTPEDVHYGRAEQILDKRASVLRKAFEANPHRFKGRCPKPAQLPKAVWINPPQENAESSATTEGGETAKTR